MPKYLKKSSYIVVLIIAIALIANIFTTTLVSANQSARVNCTPYSGGYQISASEKIAYSGPQKLYVKAMSSTGGKIKVAIGSSDCLEIDIPKSNSWKFYTIPETTASVQANTHAVNVHASSGTVNWSTLWITPGDAQCTPNDDTVRISCSNINSAVTKMYASKTTSVVWPQVISAPQPVIKKCDPFSGGYVIEASAAFAGSSERTLAIKAKSSTGGTIRASIADGNCVEVNVPKSNDWSFINLGGATQNIAAGNHTVKVFASSNTVNWSALWAYPTAAQCVPNIDTVNITCSDNKTQVTRVYANKQASLVTAKASGTQPPATQAPVTQPPATNPPVTQPPATQAPVTQPPVTQPPTTKDCFVSTDGVVTHPITLSASGTQRVWVRVTSPGDTSITISVNNGPCIKQQLHPMSSWMWMPISQITGSLNAGTNSISISASKGVRLSTLIMFNSSISCQPVDNGKNCPQETVPTTAAPTATQPPATAPPTTMDHSNMDMGGSAADNVALEQFRDNNPVFRKFQNTPSDQLPLNQLTIKANPGSNIFMQMPVGKSQFRIRCEFSHMLYDDPIIKPGQPGGSHLHMFFGNTAVNGNSTATSLVNSGGSTCSGFEANRTAYWFPTVHDAQGRARIPNEMIMYYKTEGIAKPAGGYTEMPQGLKIIAGNAVATSPQRVTYNNGWDCGSVNNNPTQSLIPANCNSSNGLMFKLHFPRCWDGSFEFDPSQPQKHVMYEINGKCPATHPKVFTGMTALVGWKLNPGETTSGWYLSSDRMPGMANKPGGQTLHGDWWGGWNKHIMKAWHDGCVNADWGCSVGYLGINNFLPGVAAGGVNELVRIPYNEKKLNTPLAYTIPARKNS